MADEYLLSNFRQLNSVHEPSIDEMDGIWNSSDQITIRLVRTQHGYFVNVCYQCHYMTYTCNIYCHFLKKHTNTTDLWTKQMFMVLRMHAQ